MSRGLVRSMSDAVNALYDASGVVQQSRLARFCLSFIEADPLLAAQVSSEMASDPRGEVVAWQALVISLTEALVSSWTEHSEPAVVAAWLRQALAAQAAGEGVK